MKLQVAHEAYDYISLKLQDSYVTNVRLKNVTYGVIVQHSARHLRNSESFWLGTTCNTTDAQSPEKLPSISRSLHELNQFFYV